MRTVVAHARNKLAIEDGIHSRGGSGRRDCKVLNTGTVGSVGIIGNAKQLLSLLLLENPHLILEHFALKSALPLMLESLELDTLQRKQVGRAPKRKIGLRTADISGILLPNLAAYDRRKEVGKSRSRLKGETYGVSEVQESRRTLLPLVGRRDIISRYIRIFRRDIHFGG